MPVESFHSWGSDPHLRPVRGTEGQRLILTCMKSRTLTTVSKKPIRTVPFSPPQGLPRRDPGRPASPPRACVRGQASLARGR